jgi:uncharacterized protein (UPF0332 family)
MDESTRATIQTRVEQAREEIKSAGVLMTADMFRAAVSRAYYGVFYITEAALLTQNVRRTKHSGTRAAFSQFLVKPGLIEPEYARVFTRSQASRQDADYGLDLRGIRCGTATELVADAERFVARMEQYLRAVGAIA